MTHATDQVPGDRGLELAFSGLLTRGLLTLGAGVLALAGGCPAPTGGAGTTPGAPVGDASGESGGAQPGGAGGAGGAAEPDVRVADTGPQVQIVNEPGKMIAMEQVLVPGKVTVVDFYADWCGACKVMENKLVEEIQGEPRIVVRKIDIVDDTSEVARFYDIGALPHFRVYRPDGELAYVLVGNEALRVAERARELLVAN